MCIMPVTYCNDPADPQAHQLIHEEWRREELEREVVREVVEARWAREDEQHAALPREWERERAQHERELKERAQHEEEEHKRMGLFWSRVEMHQCKSYGTREYSAVLMNLPVDCEWRVEVCKATPLEIRGITRLPKSCEDNVRRVCRKTWG